MYIQSIELSDYRNYRQLNIEFDENVNILYGDNAQGKTNILESLYLCGTNKSHRGSRDSDIIRFGMNESHIKMFVRKNDVSHRIDMHLKKGRSKGIAVNGIPLKKASELFGIVNIIFFSPEDLYIIKNGPSERRKFIDMELSQIDKIYMNNLIKYNKIINQRNKLLKDINFYRDSSLENTMDAWDEQLVIYAIDIIRRREKFIEELNDIIEDIHWKLSGEKEKLGLKYEPNTLADDMWRKLHDTRERDIRQKTTSCGPHRDDIGFFINDIDVRRFGSQGQQRTSALSLKLSEIEIVKKITHDIPVLLLDDVLSELDINRQNQLINSLDGIQTIVSCTGLDEFIENKVNAARIYRISNGSAKLVTASRQLRNGV